MDLASLAIFREVARERSVTRAAELLGRVPSNVSTRIQQIEAEIGVPLFQRDKRPMELTKEGEIYLDYVDRILNLADEAQQTVNPATPAGVLRVGSMESTAAARLPGALAQFSLKWPQVTIDLSTAPTRQLVDALLANRIDCALIAVPEGEWWLAQDELDKVPIFREDLMLLLPPGHPEVQHPGEIKPRALAAFAPGCTYRMLSEEWMMGLGPARSALRIHEVRSYHAMVACTAVGSCFSILPRSVLDLVPEVSRFTTRYLMRADTWLATRPGYKTPAFQVFREMLLDSSDIKGTNNNAAE
ncbi:LysR family transcriptional regulator [Rhizobium tropici]|uniref:HTH-type transcriptional regulator TtuA n=2 Tax=Rhizobium tropici TaxID=398 RepID=A0A5B0W9Q3_RHITR|nr:LysR family transcriptional regulator [Rhizobium tropici]